LRPRGADEPDDDLDDVGASVEFSWMSPARSRSGIVWDEHHDLPRHAQEDDSHNDGRHWLHFNVDDASVLVRCFDDARKISEPNIVMPGDDFTYTITLLGSPKLEAPAEAHIHDELPAEIELAGDGEIECPIGECDYDADSRTVFWFGELDAGDLATLRFTVTLAENDEYPDEIVNCAETHDGADEGTVCARRRSRTRRFPASRDRPPRDEPPVLQRDAVPAMTTTVSDGTIVRVGCG
jgi:hypothetical protein